MASSRSAASSTSGKGPGAHAANDPVDAEDEKSSESATSTVAAGLRKAKRAVTAAATSTSAGTAERTESRPSAPTRVSTAAPANAGAAAAPARTRKAKLRLVHVDPWSVMKMAFLLSIALGIVCVVAVTIIWGVLGAAGVWDSINSAINKTVGSDSSTPFDITNYIGTSRAVGFTLLASVVDVVLITALSALGAFLYNLAATLLGGVEVTFAEDR